MDFQTIFNKLLRNGISFFAAVKATGSLLTVVKIFAQLWLVLPIMYLILALMKVSVSDRGIWGRDSWGRRRFIECSNIAKIGKSKFGFYYRVYSDNGSSIDIPAWIVKDNKFVLWAKNNGVCI